MDSDLGTSLTLAEFGQEQLTKSYDNKPTIIQASMTENTCEADGPSNTYPQLGTDLIYLISNKYFSHAHTFIIFNEAW